MIPTLRLLAKNMTPSILTPLKVLKVAKHQIPAYGLTPNTSIQNKPLLVYKSAFKQGTSAGQIEEHLRSIGEVEPAWRYTVSNSFLTPLYLLCFWISFTISVEAKVVAQVSLDLIS